MSENDEFGLYLQLQETDFGHSKLSGDKLVLDSAMTIKS